MKLLMHTCCAPCSVYCIDKLREEGIETVLVNSNPATIQTDIDMADTVYTEPLTPEVVARIIEEEQVDSILPTMGGQTGLNIATGLGDLGLLDGIKVLGNRNNIVSIAQEKNIDEIIIAIASINDESLRGIIDKCKDAKVSVKIMPGVAEMIDKKFSINKIRDVNVEDLLGREAITLDHEGISDYLEGKVVLVTGGGGSIGSELCRQIAKFEPKQLIIFDIYENNAYEIQNELKRNYPNLNLVR